MSIVGVIGELLITAGVFVLLFLGWQLWLNDIVVGGQQESAAQELAESWRDRVEEPRPVPSAEPGAPVEPVVGIAPGNGEAFGTLIVPRFGADYQRVIAQGVGFDVLNSSRSGIGHYPTSQMPGEIGNFAVAAHRTTFGAPFNQINQLRLGDRIYVGTADGWYEYSFRSLEYVRPTGVGVLEPVPQAPGVEATDRVLTMTSCNPLYSAAERIIAYSVFERFHPITGEPPAEIAALVGGAG